MLIQVSKSADIATHHCEKQCCVHYTAYTCILLDWPSTQFSSQTVSEKNGQNPPRDVATVTVFPNQEYFKNMSK